MRKYYIIEAIVVEVKRVKNKGNKERLMDDYKKIGKPIYETPKGQIYDRQFEAINDADHMIER